MEEQKIHDVIIVGAGAAGLTAAIYTARRHLNTLIISRDIGGQTAIADRIENYPGFISVKGHKLMSKFDKQVRKLGVEIIYDEVRSIEKRDGNFFVKTATEQAHEARALILAFGKTPRVLNIPGEDRFGGKGVSYCATCDGPLFQGKTVAVVGGGNSALDSSCYLCKICKKVYLIHRRDEFRGDKIIQERIKKRNNVEILYDTIPMEVKGEKFVKSLVVKNVKTNETKELAVDGIFVEIGYEVKTGFLKGLIELDEINQIVINENCETSQAGIFAAGDATTVPFKQTVISAGEGAKAALSAYNYLQKGETKIIMDWS